MAVAAPRTPRARRSSARGPGAVVLAGAAAAALVAAFAAWNITAVILDETVYKLAAAQYADGVLDEHTSRGVARLYSMLIAPLFWLFDGDVAVRAARLVTSVLFAATAFPVAALARRVVASPWLAAAAGVLSVAVPWLALATILFSESLAYLLFACALLAMVRALEAPTRGAELLVLGLIGALVLTRVQFIALVPAWVAIVLWRERRAVARRYPVTTGAVALALLAALGLVVLGAFTGRLQELAGPYYGLRDRDRVPGEFGLALMWEVEMLSLGVGLIPAALAAAWTPVALAGRAGARARDLAVTGLVTIGALFAATLFAQGGWLELHSEERYFIYVVPLLWVGAVAAVEHASVTAAAVAAAGVALAAILLLVPNPVVASNEQLFLGSVSAAAIEGLPRLTRRLDEVLGTPGLISSRDLLGALALALTAFTVFSWRRGRRWLALVPAVVVQLFVVGYVFTGIHGGLPGIPGVVSDRAFSDLGWVDRATDGRADVALFDNFARDRDASHRETAFWNDEVDRVVRVPSLNLAAPPFPVFTLPLPQIEVTPDLRLAAPPPTGLLVAQPESPHLQLDAPVVRRAPVGDAALLRTTREPTGVLWIARGLDSDGHVVDDTRISAPAGRRLTLVLQPPREDGAGGGAVALDLGGVRRTVRFDGPQPVTVDVDLCDRTGVVNGTLTVVSAADAGNGRFSGGRLERVRSARCPSLR